MHFFMDAVQQNKDHPDTFEIPSEEEKDALKPGDTIKVCHGGERFWVIVKTIDGELLTGEVNNDLVRKQPFKCGDIIEFERRHIMNIWVG